MSMQVCMGALLRCSFGLAPGELVVIPENRVLVGAMPAANIMDSKPLVNVPTFGMCNSPANPEVIAATAAAAGVLTPMPCVPVTPAPWIVGAPTALIGGMPALNDTSELICIWGGVIETIEPGQFTVELP
jgi:hypothetical protein